MHLIQELAPKVVLQQLSLPMDDLRRDGGLATLRSFVWEADNSNLKRPRTDYMQDVRDQMTAQEQVVSLSSSADQSCVDCDTTHQQHACLVMM